VEEVIVYLTGDGWCGTGGCTILVLSPTSSDYKLISKITIARPPVRVLSTTSNAWHDISVLVQGGGIQPGHYAKLPFNGKTYPSNPSVPPAQPITQNAAGEIMIDSTAAETALCE
jgi:hypothetical protein